MASLQCECFDNLSGTFLWPKAVPHLLHLRGFSTIWIISCSVRFDLLLKVFPHSLHTKGFSPVWVLWCLMRLDFCMSTPSPHSLSTQKVFSPVWILWWVSKFSFWLKDFPQSLHSNSFSPVWVFWFLRIYCVRLKAFPHSLHSEGFSLLWKCLCSVRFDLWRKSFPHTLQAKGLPPLKILCWLSCDIWVEEWSHSQRFSAIGKSRQTRLCSWLRMLPHFLQSEGFFLCLPAHSNAEQGRRFKRALSEQTFFPGQV